MADDISKKILIQVEADTDQLNQSVATLNQTLDGLLQKQKQLTDSGQQNTKAYQDMAAQVKTVQAAIDNHSKAVDNNVKALGSSNNTLQQNKDLLISLLQQYDSLSKSEGNHSDNVKGLTTQINTLSNSITDQVTSLNKSSGAFDAHKATMNALSSSFDKLKGVSGTFGPSLEDAAKGFDALKSGLSIVQTGFTGVGEAIKTTGFAILITVLQAVIDYFTKTTEGSAKLKGAISAVGVVVNTINHAFESLGKFIVDAVTHPVENLKALGNMITENIINRFRAFSVILDGIMHLDFKKVGNGVIQAFSGITNATDKAATIFNAVVNGAKDTANQMVKAYVEGSKKAGEAVDKQGKKINKSIEGQIKHYKSLKKAVQDANKAKDESAQRGPELDEPKSAGVAVSDTNLNSNPSSLQDIQLKATQDTADKTVAIKKTAMQQVEDYAKQSAGKIASDALNILSSSIKQQKA